MKLEVPIAVYLGRSGIYLTGKPTTALMVHPRAWSFARKLVRGGGGGEGALDAVGAGFAGLAVPPPPPPVVRFLPSYSMFSTPPQKCINTQHSAVQGRQHEVQQQVFVGADPENGSTATLTVKTPHGGGRIF